MWRRPAVVSGARVWIINRRNRRMESIVEKPRQINSGLKGLFALFCGPDGVVEEFGEVVRCLGQDCLLEMRDPIDLSPEPPLVQRPAALLLSKQCRLFRDEAAA